MANASERAANMRLAYQAVMLSGVAVAAFGVGDLFYSMGVRYDRDLSNIRASYGLPSFKEYYAAGVKKFEFEEKVSKLMFPIKLIKYRQWWLKHILQGHTKQLIDI